MDKDSLCLELKELIRASTESPDLELDNDTDLIDSKLDIDSIDLLEMEVTLKKKYDIRDSLPRESLRSISSIADFIMNYRKAH